MWDEVQIEQKLVDIETALENLNGAEGHFKTVYESQRYILRMVLEKKLVD
jgi:hypothetical protein